MATNIDNRIKELEAQISKYIEGESHRFPEIEIKALTEGQKKRLFETLDCMLLYQRLFLLRCERAQLNAAKASKPC